MTVALETTNVSLVCTRLLSAVSKTPSATTERSTRQSLVLSHALAPRWITSATSATSEKPDQVVLALSKKRALPKLRSSVKSKRCRLNLAKNLVTTKSLKDTARSPATSVREELTSLLTDTTAQVQAGSVPSSPSEACSPWRSLAALATTDGLSSKQCFFCFQFLTLRT